MNIQVVGAGSWGLALTRVLALNGHNVSIWCREEDNPDGLRETRESPVFLPGVMMPESVQVVTDVDPGVDMAVLAVPSHVMRKIVQTYSFSADTIRVSVAKGIENDTLLRMSEVILEIHGDVPTASLSGPSHAEEVGRDLPATVVAACENHDIAETVQKAFISKTFRVYTSNDIVGVEFGGSLKNVIAIAAGASDGLKLGDNAKAALITRGLAEMSRLGIACGADPLTFAGLSGMGDLIVTCASRLSRNRAVGERLALGEDLSDVLSGPMVAEGVRTTRSVMALSKQYNIEIPIATQVYNVLFEDTSPLDAVTSLMVREAKPEKG